MAEGLGRSRAGQTGEDRRCIVTPCGSAGAEREMMRVTGKEWAPRKGLHSLSLLFLTPLSSHALEKI